MGYAWHLFTFKTHGAFFMATLRRKDALIGYRQTGDIHNRQMICLRPAMPLSSYRHIEIVGQQCGRMNSTFIITHLTVRGFTL